MRIRLAEEKDVEKIAELEVLCFDDPWSQQMIRSDVVDLPFSTYVLGEADTREAENSEFQKTETESCQLLGYVGITTVRDECQVNNVAVHPEHRKKGIGGELLKEALRIAREKGAKEAFLEVREGNEDAISLYESFGFTRLGIRRGYYENNGENAIVMRKDLDI